MLPLCLGFSFRRFDRLLWRHPSRPKAVGTIVNLRFLVIFVVIFVVIFILAVASAASSLFKFCDEVRVDILAWLPS